MQRDWRWNGWFGVKFKREVVMFVEVELEGKGVVLSAEDVSFVSLLKASS